jgi:Domain of unknown function (DUF5642)
VRSLALGVLTVTMLAGCSPERPPAPRQTTPEVITSAVVAPVNPQRIIRVRPELPAGYEVADIGGYASTPVAFWGFGFGWTAEPPQCAALVNPAAEAPARGFSGSGAGGIIHVVVVSAATGPVGLDPILLAECGQWTMTYGRSSARVTLTDAPVIDGAATLGTASVIRSAVESGTETDSRADTFMAYLGEHVVFVTLVTDPGSTEPPLPPQFASDLLVKAVTALRG